MSKKILQGTVVSAKMTKTVVVDVARVKEHPKYRKRIRVNTRYKAHNELEGISVGDRVTIEESRPLSKDKYWVVKEKIERSSPKNEERVSEDTSPL